MEQREWSVRVAVQDEARRNALQCHFEAAGPSGYAVTPVANWADLSKAPGDLYVLDSAFPGASPDALRRLLEASGVGTVLVLLEDDAPVHVAGWLRAGAAESLRWDALDRFGDVLLHIQARAEAAAGVATYRAIVENAQDIITVLGPDGLIRYESPSAERMLGFAPDELIGRNAFDFMHPDDVPHVFSVFAHGITHPGYTATVEYRFRHKDGSWRTLESRAKNLLHDPSVAGVVVNSRDLTDRKATEEALRRSEMRTRALLDALPDAMVHLTRDGVYLDVHLPRDYHAFVDPAHLVGRTVYDVLPGAVARRAVHCIQRALMTGRMQSFEYEIDVEGEMRVREARVMKSAPDEVISLQRDITERKRAEAGLRESERRLRELFESSPDAIFVESLDGQVLDANPAACQLHGFTHEEIVGKTVQDLVPPDVYAEGLEDFSRLRAGEIGYVVSYSLHASGRAIPVEIRAGRATYGRQEAVLLHVRDITERREAEVRIGRLKAFYEQVLNDLPADVSVMEPDGRILFLNPSSVRDPEMRTWLIGKTGLDYCQRRGLDPSVAEQRQRFIDRAIEARGIVQFEETLRSANGETRHILRMASPVIDADGTVTQVIGYGLDITERKRTEEALRQNEALLRTVVSNIPVILFALDATGTFTLSEGKGLEALDARPGEAVGRSAFALYHHLPAFVAQIESALAGETLRSVVEVSGRAFECWLSPLKSADDAPDGVIGVAADVTDLKRQQEALEVSQQSLRDLALHLQSVREEERTRIAREVHDVLGQALTALRMDLAWIERDLPEDHPLIGRAAGMKHLIDSTIQTVRRIASDLRPGILDDLGLAAALEWQTQQFEARTGIVCRFMDDTPPLELDRDRSTAVFRIFQEVLTNVARHAGARRVDITLSEADGRLKLSVRDDGRGIRPDELSNTRSLGLLGMRERVVPWGGHVHLEGKPGRGTLVNVVVPLEAAAQPGAEAR